MSIGENKVQEWLMRLLLKPQIIIMKKCKSNISLLSAFNCPCRVRDKSELESKRPHSLTLVRVHQLHCHQARLLARICRRACHATASQEVLFSSR